MKFKKFLIESFYIASKLSKQENKQILTYINNAIDNLKNVKKLIDKKTDDSVSISPLNSAIENIENLYNKFK